MANFYLTNCGFFCELSWIVKSVIWNIKLLSSDCPSFCVWIMDSFDDFWEFSSQEWESGKNSKSIIEKFSIKLQNPMKFRNFSIASVPQTSISIKSIFIVQTSSNSNKINVCQSQVLLLHAKVSLIDTLTPLMSFPQFFI